MFQDYKEYATRLTTMENAENYIQGMAMGVRITAEAFTLEDGETELAAILLQKSCLVSEVISLYNFYLV